MLLISILIHAMMQQFTVAEGVDCTKISCTSDCPIYLKQMKQDDTSSDLVFHLEKSTFNSDDENSTARYFNNYLQSASTNSFQMKICCSTECKNHCVTADRNVVPEGTEWQNVDDPCTSHICNNGIVSNHSSMCSPLPCPPTHHTLAPGECCPICDINWASFCPEDFDCDIACQHGFVVDSQRGCDSCKCARKTIERESTTSLPAGKATESSLNGDAIPRSIRFYFYLDPTDVATKTLIIGIAVLFFGILVAILAVVGCYFHKRVYKKIVSSA